MEKILKIFTKESGSINQAAFLLGCLTLLSQVLALFRDRSIAHFIGPSSSLDAYYAAFRVPDLIFICIASLASITVLIPFLVAKMGGDKVTDEAKKYLNDIFTVFFSLMVFMALLAFFLVGRHLFFYAYLLFFLPARLSSFHTHRPRGHNPLNPYKRHPAYLHTLLFFFHFL
jgi:putative peptidoglycan lipid II flippase